MSFNASSKGWYFKDFFVFLFYKIPLGGRGGALIFAKCEFNELHARVLGGVMCGFFLTWRRW